MVKVIPLSKGLFTLVDDIWYEVLMLARWCCTYSASDKDPYAIASGRQDGRSFQVRMHRIITGAPREMEVDHWNGNTLDNRLANLRICTAAQNRRNTRKRRDGNTSRFKGVCRAGERWIVHITVNKQNIHIGSYAREIEAAEAYNRAARTYFGEFSRLNVFPEMGTIEPRSFGKPRKESRFKYVVLNKKNKHNPWRVNYKGRSLGSYSTEEEAAEVVRRCLETSRPSDSEATT